MGWKKIWICLQEFWSAGTGAGRYLEMQGRGRPMLPREYGRHRRLLRRNGSGRRPGQKQDKARRRLSQAVPRRIVPCWNQPYDPGRMGKEHERGRSRLHLASLEPPQERCASRDSCYCQPCPFHGTIQFGLPLIHLRLFGISAIGFQRAFQCGCDHFGQVQGVAVGPLRDLFAATEAVGDDQAVGRGACGPRAGVPVRRSPSRRRTFLHRSRTSRPCRSSPAPERSSRCPFFVGPTLHRSFSSRDL